MYKIAVRLDLADKAAESLEIISSSSSNDPSLLYACCLYSMEGKNKAQTLAALQLVLDKSGYNPPTPVHLPSMVRTTIGITSALLGEARADDGGLETEVLVDKLCKLFEGGEFSSTHQVLVRT